MEDSRDRVELQCAGVQHSARCVEDAVVAAVHLETDCRRRHACRIAR